MTPPQAWELIVWRLIASGWRPPEDGWGWPDVNAANCARDTYSTAAEPLEQLVLNGEQHLGMVRCELKP